MVLEEDMQSGVTVQVSNCCLNGRIQNVDVVSSKSLHDPQRMFLRKGDLKTLFISSQVYIQVNLRLCSNLSVKPKQVFEKGSVGKLKNLGKQSHMVIVKSIVWLLFSFNLIDILSQLHILLLVLCPKFRKQGPCSDCYMWPFFGFDTVNLLRQCHIHLEMPYKLVECRV